MLRHFKLPIALQLHVKQTVFFLYVKVAYISDKTTNKQLKQAISAMYIAAPLSMIRRLNIAIFAAYNCKLPIELDFKVVDASNLSYTLYVLLNR